MKKDKSIYYFLMGTIWSSTGWAYNCSIYVRAMNLEWWRYFRIGFETWVVSQKHTNENIRVTIATLSGKLLFIREHLRIIPQIGKRRSNEFRASCLINSSFFVFIVNVLCIRIEYILLLHCSLADIFEICKYVDI